MVDSECPKIVTMQDRPFYDLHKAVVPLALCMHLTEKGLSIREAVWTARQSKSGFSVSFYWEQTEKVESGKKMNERKKREREEGACLSKN